MFFGFLHRVFGAVGHAFGHIPHLFHMHHPLITIFGAHRVVAIFVTVTTTIVIGVGGVTIIIGPTMVIQPRRFPARSRSLLRRSRINHQRAKIKFAPGGMKTVSRTLKSPLLTMRFVNHPSIRYRCRPSTVLIRTIVRLPICRSRATVTPCVRTSMTMVQSSKPTIT